ncbi:MAG: isopentenyl phosphate kinase, partial [Promethearchaeota archaeon]
MTKDKKIILLKLGGSLLTDKNKPFSIREDVVKTTIRQIIDAKEKLVLIHGGGSFGHPLAKKYSLSKGLDNSIPNQILGISETHQSMVKFNNYVINNFLELDYPVLSIQPSSIFIKDSQVILTKSLDVIETALDLNILPILYGDIILDKQVSFAIISGDQIILELCEKLHNYSISKVVFAMESDGLYIRDKEDSENYQLVTQCYSNELDSLNLADLGQKIDVTGGIRSKV